MKCFKDIKVKKLLWKGIMGGCECGKEVGVVSFVGCVDEVLDKVCWGFLCNECYKKDVEGGRGVGECVNVEGCEDVEVEVLFKVDVENVKLKVVEKYFKEGVNKDI